MRKKKSGTYKVSCREDAGRGGGGGCSPKIFFNMYCFRSHLELSRSKILSVIEDDGGGGGGVAWIYRYLINALWLSKI